MTYSGTAVQLVIMACLPACLPRIVNGAGVIDWDVRVPPGWTVTVLRA
ncbi:hypothetical protein [Streptomyces chumphonensis]